MIGSCDICDAQNVPVTHHHPDSLGPEGNICYLCQGDVFDPYCEMVEVECPCCGGEGEIIHETGIDRRDGSIMEWGHRCAECNGRGGVWIAAEPITLDDFDDCFGAAT